jgi:hypothetical protein
MGGGVSAERSEFELSEYQVTVLTTTQWNLLADAFFNIMPLCLQKLMELVINLELPDCALEVITWE